MTSQHYIEVIGEGLYQEIPEQVILDIQLSVRAAQEETAAEDNKKFANTLINELLAHGLTQAEIRFGGRQSYTPWWKRKKAGQETRTKITVVSARRDIAYKAVDSISRYLNNKRISVEVSERQPIFKTPDGAVSQAFEAAMVNAKEKAEHLANLASCRLGNVLEIQEWRRDMRHSGSYGDSDWWGDSGAMRMAAGAGINEFDDDPAGRLQGNARTIYIKFRVRYGILGSD